MISAFEGRIECRKMVCCVGDGLQRSHSLCLHYGVRVAYPSSQNLDEDLAFLWLWGLDFLDHEGLAFLLEDRCFVGFGD